FSTRLRIFWSTALVCQPFFVTRSANSRVVRGGMRHLWPCIRNAHSFESGHMFSDRQGGSFSHSTYTVLLRMERSISQMLKQCFPIATREYPKHCLKRRTLLEHACPLQQISQARMAKPFSSTPRNSARHPEQRSFQSHYTFRFLRVKAVA